MNPKGIKIKQPPVLFDDTQAIIRDVERLLGDTFLAYWNSSNGSVCGNDPVALYEILRKIGPRERLFLFIKSDGGSGIASLRLVHLLRQYARRLTALIPLDCASAATMLALGADDIQMGPLAYLTAVDTSITHELSPADRLNELVSVSQDELTRVIKLWNRETKEGEANPYQHLYQYVHPLVIGAIDRASSLSIKICREILSYHLTDAETAERISDRLNADYPSHSYPITIREAEQIGLQVRPMEPAVNDLLLELNELYSEMGQRAVTDFSETKYHNNEILNIVEGQDIQLFFQNDKDWHYMSEERRWSPMNDESAWHRLERADGKVARTFFHIR
jgi:hypothetical protein